MKILVASDIHGSASATRGILKSAEELGVDRILLLGDILYHGPRNPLPSGYDPLEVVRLLNENAERIVCVRGNCEAEVDRSLLSFDCWQTFARIDLDDGRLLFATHGHRENMAPDDLPALPEGSIFASGHTHVKRLEAKDGIILINPGSPSLPKDGTPSFGIVDEGLIELRNLDGSLITSLTLH